MYKVSLHFILIVFCVCFSLRSGQCHLESSNQQQKDSIEQNEQNRGLSTGDRLFPSSNNNVSLRSDEEQLEDADESGHGSGPEHAHEAGEEQVYLQNSGEKQDPAPESEYEQEPSGQDGLNGAAKSSTKRRKSRLSSTTTTTEFEVGRTTDSFLEKFGTFIIGGIAVVLTIIFCCCILCCFCVCCAKKKTKPSVRKKKNVQKSSTREDETDSSSR